MLLSGTAKIRVENRIRKEYRGLVISLAGTSGTVHKRSYPRDFIIFLRYLLIILS